MHLRYTIPRALAILLAVSLISATASAGASGSHSPTPAQIRNAVRSAEHSRSLWATINICNTTKHPHELGLRGQMPALGFEAGLYMIFEVEYRSPVSIAFHADPGTRKRVFLGRAALRVHQAGLTFRFTKSAQLAGRVEFQWELNGKLIGHVTRRTTGGHSHVDGGDPPGHSVASCSMN